MSCPSPRKSRDLCASLPLPVCGLAENYALLLGDICVLLGFRLTEDILLSPVPRLDIDAYPDVIEKGLGLYAEPALAFGHVWTYV